MNAIKKEGQKFYNTNALLKFILYLYQKTGTKIPNYIHDKSVQNTTSPGSFPGLVILNTPEDGDFMG